MRAEGRIPREVLTERMLLRQWQPDDVEPLAEIYRQPEFLAQMSALDREGTRMQIERFSQRWQDDGFSVCWRELLTDEQLISMATNDAASASGSAWMKASHERSGWASAALKAWPRGTAAGTGSGSRMASELLPESSTALAPAIQILAARALSTDGNWPPAPARRGRAGSSPGWVHRRGR
jgi:hypothetical protein